MSTRRRRPPAPSAPAKSCPASRVRPRASGPRRPRSVVLHRIGPRPDQVRQALRALGASQSQCERGLRSLPLIVVHGVDEQEARALQVPLSKTGGLFRVWHTDDVTGYRNLSPRT